MKMMKEMANHVVPTTQRMRHRAALPFLTTSSILFFSLSRVVPLRQVPVAVTRTEPVVATRREFLA
eukprot:CAMPEP_0198583608 /NCGR_PEP_ID=MMETSP1462-20131121/126944_1 /TAXON_ID=1333877 /ORGANISM="Brandtodinium nutriculum, Strain RCC3387" /LENGTH=65 /DNA_ID=CAMNT_0044315023 /DNA_START=22 /DNA_END=215 /DNA_ORIENTATION=-